MLVICLSEASLVNAKDANKIPKKDIDSYACVKPNDVATNASAETKPARDWAISETHKATMPYVTLYSPAAKKFERKYVTAKAVTSNQNM